MRRFSSILNGVLFPSKKISIIIGIVLSLLVPLTFLLVYQTGGIKFVYSHTMYIPIVFIGVIFGLKWGILTAITGAILLGPLMPIDTITGEEQELANWLYRTLIFVFIGAFSGYFSDALRKRQRDKDLQIMHRIDLINKMQLGFAEHEMIYDENGEAINYKYLYVNDEFCDLTGCKKEDIEGRLVTEVYPNVDKNRVKRYETLFTSDKEITFESYFENQNVWYELKAYKSDTNKFITLFFDITQTKEMNKQLEYINIHHPLTELLNYSGLLKDINKIDMKNSAICFYITLPDLNEYRSFYGSDIADLVIKEVANNLKKYNNEKYLVFHTLDNHFIFILIDPTDIELKNILNNARHSLMKNMQTAEYLLSVKQHIGYSFSTDEFDLIELVNKARIANGYSAFDEHSILIEYNDGMLNEIENNLKMANRLQEAIETDLIDIYFQKIINSSNQSITFVEALARWNDPIMGFVAPDKFISFAIESKLIDQLDDYLIDKSLLSYAHFIRNHDSRIKLSLNISSSALFRRNFIDYILKCVKKYELNPSQVIIEISENTFVNGPKESIEQIINYKNKGFLIAIDDFGSKYSSLSILDSIPFDVLKLDGIFSDGYKSRALKKIVDAVIDIVKNQEGKMVVAEKIETEEQAKFFKELNCYIHQGYLYHKPEKL